jgi:IS30 family transposase
MNRLHGKHLTQDERCQIYALLKSGKSKRFIANQLCVSHTTIVRETKRNEGRRGYRCQQAHEKAVSRRALASMRTYKLTPDVIDKIKEQLLDTQASPVQISGHLLKIHGIKISHESIYRLIWEDQKKGGKLYKHLRHKAKKYNKRGSKKAGRGLIPNRVDIEERPQIVNEKIRLGDFELDTIVGAHHKGAIVSIVDRCSKFSMLELIPHATKEVVREAIIKRLSPFRKDVHTLTFDNGKEFADHEKISRALNASSYFAKPYHSWERGLNEHTNGLVRQYFPKHTDFTILTSEQVRDVEKRLNSRPRRILNFETPQERFLSLCT